MGAWVRGAAGMGSGGSYQQSGFCTLQPLIPACRHRGEPASRALGLSLM